MTGTLPRRLLAEAIGTGLLVTVVVGSGISAQRLSPDAGLDLLANSLATVGGLAVLILALGPVSGAHFNPLVSLADWWLGRRARDGLTPTELSGYLPAQFAGAVGGAVLANLMYGLPAITFSHHVRSGSGRWLGEAVATAGLLFVIVALARTGRAAQTAWAVAAYIGAAYWFTSSTAFANPAVTVGRMFSDTFAGIAPAGVPAFVAAQLAGAAAGLVLLALLYPGSPARGVVVPRTPVVLFVCVHNAGRSQIAAALLDRYAAGRVDVLSAGSAPADSLHPAVVESMAEIGIDLRGHRPRLLSTTAVEAADVVVTMGCGDACPVFPGKRYEDWALDDPAGQDLATVRRIRDDIDARVRVLLAGLVGPGATAPDGPRPAATGAAASSC